MSVKIISWNVNSLRVRLPQVLECLSHHQPDIIALQETKVLDVDFPFDLIQQAGYQACYSGQKTYNGVALLSKIEAMDPITDIDDLDDPQRRILAATIGKIRIVNLYVPNGESVQSDKYQYKLNWLNKVKDYLKQALQTHSYVIVLGDFNIAPDPRDVYDPHEWEGRVLFSEPEREAFQALLALGLVDVFRLHSSSDKHYTWWDYRMNAFKRNRGLRIDHILASEALGALSTSCSIDTLWRASERPSDHAPILAEFNLSIA